MKKLLTPIIHGAFTIPLLFIAMGSIEFMAQKFDVLPDYIRVFEVPYVFLTLGILVISGLLLFWLANRLMQSVEKLENPTFKDHFRQSIFFYFIIAYSIFNWISAGFTGGDTDLYFLVLSAFSMVSILINYIFLFRKLRAKTV